MTDRPLRIWTVYDLFPGGFVARMSEVDKTGVRETANVTVSTDLEALRAILRDDMHLTRIERDPRDDAVIVEVWV